MPTRERIITDVEEACALREAGLLWRRTGFAHAGDYVPDDNQWKPNELRRHWLNMPGSFFIVLED